MSDVIRFSIIIPLHDKAPHVASAIESALAQDHAAHEIIVIDDASTDGGDRIVAGYARQNVQLLRRNEPGPGGYAARNLGIDHATGDWIAFLDADDHWREDHLSTLSSLIKRFPDAGMAATRYRHVFASGAMPDTVAPLLAQGNHELAFRAFLAAWLTAGHCPVWTSATAIRRSMLTADRRFPAGKALRGGDKDLWLRVSRAAPLAFSAEFTADFHREAVNKVTARTDTRSLPCLVPTARAMMVAATPQEKRLIRRLINQEIGLYARWSAGAGRRPSLGLRDLHYPASPVAMLSVLGARLLPSALLKLPARLAQYWRKQRKVPISRS